MRENRPRLGFRDYLWVAFGVLIVPATAIVLDQVGLVDTSTRAMSLAVAGLSAMACTAAWAYRQQLAANRRSGSN